MSVISPSITAGISGIFSSCEEQYEKAWAACNRKYNGKCSYLGDSYKPSCKKGDVSLVDKLFSSNTKRKPDRKQRFANQFDGLWVWNTQGSIGSFLTGDLSDEFENLLVQKGVLSVYKCRSKAIVRNVSKDEAFLADTDTIVDMYRLVRCMKRLN